MKQSPSEEADSHSTGQQIPHLSWNQQFHSVFTVANY
jgi:hypothetical protein